MVPPVESAEVRKFNSELAYLKSYCNHHKIILSLFNYFPSHHHYYLVLYTVLNNFVLDNFMYVILFQIYDFHYKVRRLCFT